MESGETHSLAKYLENGWSFMDNRWLLHLPSKSKNDGHIFELTGTKTVSIYYPILKSFCYAMIFLGS